MPFSYVPLAVSRASITNVRRMVLLAALVAASAVLWPLGYRPAPAFFPLFGVGLGLAVVYRLILDWRPTRQVADAVQTIAFCGDVALATGLLLAGGGSWWLGATFHAFIVTFAFAGLPRGRAVAVTAFAVLAYIALLVVEGSGMVVVTPLFGLPPIAGNWGLALTVATLGSVAIIAFALVQNTFVRIMRRSQERYRLVVQTAPDLIVVTDRGGVVLSANEAAQLFAASRRQPILGEHFARFAHPDEAERFASRIADAAAGQSYEIELRLLGPHGEEQWYICSCNSMREDTEIVGVLVVARDITSRKQQEETLRRSEEQLRQAQKMEAVGRLAGGIAHDFNNLLTVISAYSEFLMRGVDDGTARRQDVEGIYNASLRAATLTNQLLAFSRGQVKQPTVIDLNATVVGMEQMLRRLIDATIIIDTRLYPDLGYVCADGGQLEQVLLNLAVNARDAMPGGGSLRIETDDVLLDSEYVARYPNVKPGRYVMLSVGDTGQGMDDETARRAFEPFFTTKAVGLGTGLGLATVYGIVDQSGGHVTIESEVGRGTTVRVYLPLAEDGAVAAAPSPMGVGELPRGTETVLLVEDNELLREVTERILAEFGYRVIVARDGEEALSRSQAHTAKIHLLITDVVMPYMGGRELALALWSHRPDMRVLFMSGYTEDTILRQGLRRPTVSFLAKPFRPEALARKVRDVLDRGVPTPPEAMVPVGVSASPAQHVS